MPAWLSNNLFSLLLLLGFFVLLGLWLWLRYRMSVSKARFALATVTTLGACLVSLLTFLGGPLPLQIANGVLSATRDATGISWIPTLPSTPGVVEMVFAFFSTTLAMFLIYRFSMRAIINWNGPITVNVNDLAKLDQDDNLGALARVEARRILSRQADPIVNEDVINWRQKQSEAPPRPPWHEFARNVFETAYAEAIFDHTSWRDRGDVWAGKIYTRGSETAPLLLFVFDEEPSDTVLSEQISDYLADAHPGHDTKVYAVFNEGSNTPRTLPIEGLSVYVLPVRHLLKEGLKPTQYARDLIRKYDTETLGGTEATLNATFVPAHVHKPKSSDRQSLSDILSVWVHDTSRRHLAITGEYGQGKSTAMLEFCVQWARRFVANEAEGERIPLLIELRGQNPAEADPVAFLSAWASRYGMNPKQLYNLIRAGDAVVIFEGFDELRNAGREYDRHEHFNALWRMAYPGTKLIFTGRPNFFLDEKEKNRTLRSDENNGAAGNVFTEVWELDRLTDSEVAVVASGYGAELGHSIMETARNHPEFFEIISRPSMLPVVATIWPDIKELQSQGHDVTSAILIERYLKAIYLRKEQEIENDRRTSGAPDDASYLLLPLEVREVLTLTVVWKMAGLDARNTITRRSFNAVIDQCYDEVLRMFQSQAAPGHLAQAIRRFEERFKEESIKDRRERVANEVASSGLFVPDPAGGPSNLRLPHKQFYEYLIAKAAWIALVYPQSMTAKLIIGSDRNRSIVSRLRAEDLPFGFLSDLVGENYKPFCRIRYVVIFETFRVFSSLLEYLVVATEISLRPFAKKNSKKDIGEVVPALVARAVAKEVERQMVNIRNDNIIKYIDRIIFSVAFVAFLSLQVSLVIRVVYAEKYLTLPNVLTPLLLIFSAMVLRIRSVNATFVPQIIDIIIKIVEIRLRKSDPLNQDRFLPLHQIFLECVRFLNEGDKRSALRSGVASSGASFDTCSGPVV